MARKFDQRSRMDFDRNEWIRTVRAVFADCQDNIGCLDLDKAARHHSHSLLVAAYNLDDALRPEPKTVLCRVQALMQAQEWLEKPLPPAETEEIFAWRMDTIAMLKNAKSLALGYLREDLYLYVKPTAQQYI